MGAKDPQRSPRVKAPKGHPFNRMPKGASPLTKPIVSRLTLPDIIRHIKKLGQYLAFVTSRMAITCNPYLSTEAIFSRLETSSAHEFFSALQVISVMQNAVEASLNYTMLTFFWNKWFYCERNLLMFHNI